MGTRSRPNPMHTLASIAIEHARARPDADDSTGRESVSARRRGTNPVLQHGSAAVDSMDATGMRLAFRAGEGGAMQQPKERKSPTVRALDVGSVGSDRTSDEAEGPTLEELRRTVSQQLFSSGSGLGISALEAKIRNASSFRDLLTDPAFRGRRGQAFLSRARQELYRLWHHSHPIEPIRQDMPAGTRSLLQAVGATVSTAAQAPTKAVPKEQDLEERESEGVKPRRLLPVSGMFSSRF